MTQRPWPRFDIHRLAAALLCASAATASAQPNAPVVGQWKRIAHVSTYEGQTMDTHAAVLTLHPCAAKILHEVNADGSFRLNARDAGCDPKYAQAQERLYAKTRWKLEGNTFTTSATNFAVGQRYTVVVSGNRMTWTGLDGQGTITFVK